MLKNILKVLDILIADGETMRKSFFEQFISILKVFCLQILSVIILETGCSRTTKFYKLHILKYS